jgi:hypothetical protein
MTPEPPDRTKKLLLNRPKCDGFDRDGAMLLDALH